MLDILDPQLLPVVAKVDEVAGRARGGHGRDFIKRELALGENVQKLSPDIARRSHDRDPVTHVLRFPLLEWRRSGR